ncbi:DUF2933 domain-containing protein [Parasphingorhabdus sp.]|jgi:uncharacterized membrane protein YjgN (DUF898 family)|uniref:DUF2933 domain-containing protein n=1 Tax=Parasphingorhabdus sp. TaxID=2709688 RepID=UPI002F93240B|tara:strand:- start:8995 stop:9222 length:228 start_codon:yes stop_codon:yes gene_type:complete
MKNNKPAPRRFALTLTYIVVFLGAIVVGGYLMTHQHQAHIPGLYLLLGALLLACITMFLFMRGGRHGYSNKNGEE